MTRSICSDARMKTQISPWQPEGSVLDKVQKLKAAIFQWAHQLDDKRYVGLIAQEVEAVLPEVVTTTPTAEGQKGLSCVGLEAVVLEAIKEQQAQIEVLKAEVERLKAKVFLKKYLTNLPHTLKISETRDIITTQSREMKTN